MASVGSTNIYQLNLSILFSSCIPCTKARTPFISYHLPSLQIYFNSTSVWSNAKFIIDLFSAVGIAEDKEKSKGKGQRKLKAAPSSGTLEGLPAGSRYFHRSKSSRGGRSLKKAKKGMAFHRGNR